MNSAPPKSAVPVTRRATRRAFTLAATKCSASRVAKQTGAVLASSRMRARVKAKPPLTNYPAAISVTRRTNIVGCLQYSASCCVKAVLRESRVA